MSGQIRIQARKSATRLSRGLAAVKHAAAPPIKERSTTRPAGPMSISRRLNPRGPSIRHRQRRRPEHVSWNTIGHFLKEIIRPRGLDYWLCSD